MRQLDLLIAEDNVSDARLIKRILEKENLTTSFYWVKDGEQIVDYLMKMENPLPKVVVLDIKMPRLDGFGVLRQLKADKRTSKIPIIMYSSSSEVSDIDLAYTLGANSYLSKPTKLENMKELFTRICHYWISTNRTVYDA